MQSRTHRPAASLIAIGLALAIAAIVALGAAASGVTKAHPAPDRETGTRIEHHWHAA